ncbi:MAG: hypothetical protein O2999_01800 [Nitrospirae bacterium]|nr:hypothetical protein [Nitrospirota bacterium]MDA1303035.1 hypothetical protein [Nitrospirota bacterium]
MKSFNARVHPIFGLMVVFLLTGLLSFPLQAQAAAKVVTGEIVNLVVDADNCLLGTTMCTEIGTSGQQAQHGNDSGVLLMMQLIKPNGQPLTGLGFTDFFVDA